MTLMRGTAERKIPYPRRSEEQRFSDRLAGNKVSTEARQLPNSRTRQAVTSVTERLSQQTIEGGTIVVPSQPAETTSPLTQTARPYGLMQPNRISSNAVRLFLSAVLSSPFILGIGAVEMPQQETESAIEGLVESIAKPLQHTKAKKVIVFDFRGPNQQSHPVGKWLADQVSITVHKEFPNIEAIDRSLLGTNNSFVKASADPHEIFVAEINQARSLGAGAFITGSFAKISGQIGVSLLITDLSDPGKTLDVGTGLVPISTAITDLTTESIPGQDLHDGIARAGSGGVTMPICISCPAPMFPGEHSRYTWPPPRQEGVVLLEIVVTPEGRTGKVKVIKSPSPDLADKAVVTVKDWRFKPAIGFDGRPVPVFTPIRISFQPR